MGKHRQPWRLSGAKRHYAGCDHVDVVEMLAIDRARRLSKAGFANVQPHCGAQANQGVFLALLQPGDRIMGLDLAHGGRLTHGSPVIVSGKWFDVVSYGVEPDIQLIDIAKVRAKALEARPKRIIACASAYPRAMDFAAFRAIADEVGAFLMVDMAHYAGLVAAGLHPDPLPRVHVMATTSHKTLRGPRGGMILMHDKTLAKTFNSAVFSGDQGGPLTHVIAAKAAAFGEALKPAFRDYVRRVIANAQRLASVLKGGGLGIVSGGADCHMALVDLRPFGLKGRDAEVALEHAGLTCNKNAIPFDPEKPFVTSGIRLGASAGATRGFGEAEFAGVGRLIPHALNDLAKSGQVRDEAKVRALCAAHPIYAD